MMISINWLNLSYNKLTIKHIRHILLRAFYLLRTYFILKQSIYCKSPLLQLITFQLEPPLCCNISAHNWNITERTLLINIDNVFERLLSAIYFYISAIKSTDNGKLKTMDNHRFSQSHVIASMDSHLADRSGDLNAIVGDF